MAWLSASSRIADPCFGVKAGNHWQPSMFGALGYTWLASTSLCTALGRLARYTDLVLERGAVEVLDGSGGDVTVTLAYRGGPFTLPALADALLSFLLRLCRLNAGDALNPKRVTLFHSAPADAGPCFAYFRCPVEFDADRDSLTEIAFMLGFSEPSAFTRAYRRGTGQSPSEAREETAASSGQ